MPYIGRSLGDGVRARYIYAATSWQTTFSGNDANGIALAYSDTLYMDVYQNGVLLKPVTDYASTTGTSVVLVTGASADDVLEMIVYDSFAVADTVSAANGGTFSGTVSMSDDLNVDSGTLFVDASANRVGIGTTSPSQLLSISDSGSARMEIISGTSGTSIIDMGDTADADIAGIRYAHGTDTLSFRSGNDVRMTISGDGEVLMPAQPAFLVRPQNPQNNVGSTSDGALQVVTLDNELYDVGGNFASNAFTAPVTGKYLLTMNMYLSSVDSAAHYIAAYIYPSNRTYLWIIDPDFGQDAVYWTPSLTVVADMDANDTAGLRIAQYQGTAQMDIQPDSNFSGCLIA